MSWINDWIGVPYLANGRGPAYDCYGLVMAVYKQQLDVILPDWQSKTDTFKSQSTEMEKRLKFSLNNDFVEVVTKPDNFDFVMAYKERYCNHIGIYHNGNVLHVHHKSCGATYERLEDFKKQHKKVRFLKWRK